MEGPAEPKKMRNVVERSAGVIVYHTLAPDSQRRYLLLDYGRYWDLPKGHLEKGEDDRTAALRELREETGLSGVSLDPMFSRTIEYFFRDRRKGLVHKTVTFFVAQTSTDRVVLSEEHVGSRFEPFDSAVATVKYPSTKQVIRDAEGFLVGDRLEPSGTDGRE